MRLPTKGQMRERLAMNRWLYFSVLYMRQTVVALHNALNTQYLNEQNAATPAFIHLSESALLMLFKVLTSVDGTSIHIMKLVE
jgi:hypothetical protein